MRIITLVILLSVNLSTAFAQAMTADQQQVVQEFIDYFKNKQKEKLAKAITYPFSRAYPIPSIKNKQEFLARFKEVFDDSLTKLIVTSTPSKDWSAMGWRGIMFLNGEIWLDFDGRLMAVNYQSQFEAKRKAQLINLEKSQIHASVREFVAPEYILKTSTFRIRIDDMGEGKFRYAAWKLPRKMSDKPDLIINNGQIVFEGSGGNHYFEFVNEEYKYECSIIRIGEEDGPPARLTIYKGGSEILSQNATIVTK